MRNKVFIVAEAGSNWKAGSPKEDLKRAKALIDAAKASGADAVKFQTFRAETVYVPNAGMSYYLAANGIRKSISDIFKEMTMPYEMIPVLASYCKKKNIEFMSSAFSEQDFQAVDPYVKRHKIASYEITHSTLLALTAKSKKQLILSTAAATVEDIDWAVAHFIKNGGKNITLLQCTAKYPAPFKALNLKAISFLRDRYKVSVGFSDHSRDAVIAPVAAVALGASVIEKHFTLDNRLAGPDHAFAVTPKELKQMVDAIRACEESLGSGAKEVLTDERELKLFAQRAVQATRDIQKGEVLREGENVAILRPGRQKQGMHPKFLKEAHGKRSTRFIPLGQGVGRGDYGGAR